MYHIGILRVVLLSGLELLCSCNSQNTQNQITDVNATVQTEARVGGRCETCELMYVGMPESINATDTSAAWNAEGQKLLVTGTVYKPDGNTPASDVILYYWQTDPSGIYAEKPGLDPKVKRHGYIRGWVKTGNDGKYSLYTIRPGSYPNSQNPQHIHMLVKEPQFKNEYYIDDIHFEDDPLLTEQVKQQLGNKGGNGVGRPVTQNSVQRVNRDIILGMNVSDYPKK